MDRLLLVDDERSVHDVLRAYLEHNGFEVLSAFTGREALAMAQERSPALVVLDLELPDIPGQQVCMSLRASSDVPVIMLTSHASEEERIVGLNLGADDFIRKPYSPREVVARVKAVLRRGASAAQRHKSVIVLDGGRLRVDPVRHEAVLDGQVLHLTPAEYKLLHALAEHPGRAFTRLELVEQITGDEYAGYERTVDAHVKNLRRKLGPGTPESQWIETVRGFGYRLSVRRS